MRNNSPCPLATIAVIKAVFFYWLDRKDRASGSTSAQPPSPHQINLSVFRTAAYWKHVSAAETF